jgi:hypothetical protein
MAPSSRLRTVGLPEGRRSSGTEGVASFRFKVAEQSFDYYKESRLGWFY